MLVTILVSPKEELVVPRSYAIDLLIDLLHLEQVRHALFSDLPALNQALNMLHSTDAQLIVKV